MVYWCIPEAESTTVRFEVVHWSSVHLGRNLLPVTCWKETRSAIDGILSCVLLRRRIVLEGAL